MAIIDGDLKIWCGCFRGSMDELNAYIESGKDELKESRMITTECVYRQIEYALEQEVKKKKSK